MSNVTVVARIVVQSAVYGAMLFVPAGTLHWWRAWVFLGVVGIIGTGLTVWALRGDPDLLEERLKAPIQAGQPLADRVAVLALIATLIGDTVLAPLDVFHLHLLNRPPLLVSALGLALCVAGWWIIAMVLKENSYAAMVVKSQEERGQRVIDTGVYAVVRHPMYAGAILYLAGGDLWLESYAAAACALLPAAVLAVRIHVEERFLRRELPGYEEYTRRVRFRLIPCVW